MTGVHLDPADPRPVWLLDVDGVLNVSRNAWHEAPFHGDVLWRRTGTTYRFHWSPTLLRRIHRVHRDGLAELVWCTTWCPEADSLERLWKLPPLKRAFVGYTESTFGAWRLKLGAAEYVLEQGRPLIWTDDEIPHDRAPRPWMEAFGALLITTTPRRGLTPADMDTIEAYARQRVGTAGLSEVPRASW